jgi:hypothetical protein
MLLFWSASTTYLSSPPFSSQRLFSQTKKTSLKQPGRPLQSLCQAFKFRAAGWAAFERFELIDDLNTSNLPV